LVVIFDHLLFGRGTDGQKQVIKVTKLRVLILGCGGELLAAVGEYKELALGFY